MTKPFTKTQLFLALIVLIILSAIPLIIYTYFFSSHHRSFDPANWGTFGDFIGGTTNVILGVINIVITAYIAYLIKTLDDKRFEEQKALETQRFEEQKQLDELRHQQNIDLQNDIFIRSIREDVFKEFNQLHKEFSSLYRKGGHLKEKRLDIQKIKESHVYLKLNKEHIFNTFTNTDLYDSLEDIFNRMIDFFDMNIKKIENHSLKIENIDQKEYVNLFSEYIACITSIKVKLMKEIMTNETPPNFFSEDNKKTSE